MDSLYPLLMFFFLFVGLAGGIHIAFLLAAVPLVFAFFLWGIPGMLTYVQGAWGAMNNFALTAVPLFVFMAVLLEKSGVVEDLYLAFYKWSGPLRGGLAVATVIVGAIVGAVSGVVAAGVIGLGLIALPRMEHYKYDRGINMGSVLVAGTLGQLIPPSLVMVIYGAVTNLSVGKLFAAGVSSGILLTIIFCAYILIRAWINPAVAPALPPDQRATWGEKFIALKSVFLPACLILICMGAIFTGAATPTEGAAFGALGAILFASLNWPLSLENVTGKLFRHPQSHQHGDVDDCRRVGFRRRVFRDWREQGSHGLRSGHAGRKNWSPLPLDCFRLFPGMFS